MTSKEMMQANGGRKRYECVACGKEFRTWVGALGHYITHGKPHNSFYRF